MKRTLIFKTAVAVFIAAILLTAEAFCVFDCKVIYYGGMLNGNRSISLTFTDRMEASKKFQLELYAISQLVGKVPIATIYDITNYQTETNPYVRYRFNIDEDTAFNSAAGLLSNVMKQSLKYEDVFLKISRVNDPNDFIIVLYDLRLLTFYTGSLDEPRLEYVSRNCFEKNAVTSVSIGTYWFQGSWHTYSPLKVASQYPDYEMIELNWLDENKNPIPGAKDITRVDMRPMNKYTYLRVQAKNKNSGLIYTQILGVKPYQAPEIEISFPREKKSGLLATAEIKCVTEDITRINCQQTYPTTSAMSSSSSGNNEITFSKSNLSPGRYEFFLYTEFKFCENRINYVINLDGTATITQARWFSKGMFETDNSTSANVIKIFGLSLSEEVYSLREVRIANIAGQIVQTIPIDFELGGAKWADFTINVDELLKGSYLLSFIDGEGNQIGSTKFIKD